MRILGFTVALLIVVLVLGALVTHAAQNAQHQRSAQYDRIVNQ